MIAVLATTFVMRVEDEQEAATVAIDVDKSALLNIESALEQKGASADQLDGELAFLGTSVTMLPDKFA